MLKATCLFFYLLGKWVLKLRFGAGSENVTVLGVCSAAGLVLDPLIIFKGKNMQYSWHGDKALPNTYYGKSKNGMNIIGISCKIKIDIAKKWAKFLKTIYEWVYFHKCAGLWSATLLKDKLLHRYF